MDYHDEKSIGYPKEEGVLASDTSVEQVQGEYVQHNDLKRQLKNRHIAMISCVFYIILSCASFPYPTALVYSIGGTLARSAR